MKFIRPRFTVRRLMVAVAIVAFVIATLKRSEDYRRRADHFRSLQPDYISYQSALRDFWIKQEYYAQMEQKYRDAAWLPWLPVAPDPPEPE
jgi:hypothetical protein